MPIALATSRTSAPVTSQSAAVELIEKIPMQYPQSSLSVKISEGNFQVQGQSIEALRKSKLVDR